MALVVPSEDQDAPGPESGASRDRRGAVREVSAHEVSAHEVSDTS
jgi:hypothetical protein